MGAVDPAWYIIIILHAHAREIDSKTVQGLSTFGAFPSVFYCE